LLDSEDEAGGCLRLDSDAWLCTFSRALQKGRRGGCMLLYASWNNASWLGQNSLIRTRGNVEYVRSMNRLEDLPCTALRGFGCQCEASAVTRRDALLEVRKRRLRSESHSRAWTLWSHNKQQQLQAVVVHRWPSTGHRPIMPRPSCFRTSQRCGSPH
jgi:hypothetical protein